MRIITFLFGIILLEFSFAIQAQEVENPKEELADKVWYLTKLVIEEEEIPFIPIEAIPESTFLTGSIGNDNTVVITIKHFNDYDTEIYLIDDNEFIMGDFVFMANNLRRNTICQRT